MEICRILAITPYESMKNMLAHLCAEHSEVHLSACVGDLEQGVQMLKNIPEDDYDVVISRGGTAKQIRANTRKPVVEIPLSSYDVLSAMKLSENFVGRCAMVAYPSIAETATLLCTVLQYQIPVYTIFDAESIHKTIDKLCKQGITMIIGDVASVNYAKSKSLDALLVTSGAESLESAVKQAIYLHQLLSVHYVENVFFQKYFQENSYNYAIVKHDQRIISQSDKLKVIPGIQQVIRRLIPAVEKTGSCYQIKKMREQAYYISGNRMFVRDEVYYVFVFKPLPLFSNSAGESPISLYNIEDIPKLFFKNYASFELRDSIEHYAVAHAPVLILGEHSTNKDKVANALYVNSSMKDQPLCVIDCANANDKFWDGLFNHADSPLYVQRITLYFKNANVLNNAQADALCSHINWTGGSRCIFSVVMGESDAQKYPIVRYLRETYSCLTLRLPPLRERIHEIPALCTLYLNEANTSLSRNIIGFEPEAMELMQSYGWPGNLSQFKCIIQELVLLSDKPYISAELVHSKLELETAAFSPKSGEGFQTDRSLNEMISDLVRIAIKNNGGNQSRAAKKLGISRTTLWRILQK